MSDNTTDSERTPKRNRLSVGEAHAICKECGSRLYSFHGDKDVGRRCPYINGECNNN